MLALFDMNPPIVSGLKEPNITAESLQTRSFERMRAMWSEKEKRYGPVLRQVEKMVLLQVIDRMWRGHLQQLDYLRQGIGWRGYAQKDPINEFTRESFQLFENLLAMIRRETVMILSRVEIQVQTPQAVQEQEKALQAQTNATLAQAQTSGEAHSKTAAKPAAKKAVSAAKPKGKTADKPAKPAHKTSSGAKGTGHKSPTKKTGQKAA